MFEFSPAADPQFVRNQHFHDACRTGDAQTALRLLDENPDDHHLIDVTRSDFPAILMAADGQHWDLSAELIRRGVELNVKNRQGYSPIHVFAKHGKDDLVALAIENAALVNRRDARGRSPMYFAAEAGQESTCSVLFSLGGEVNTLTYEKDSPMHCAARLGNASLARLLLEKGAHVHGENDLGETPILLATDPSLRAELERSALVRTVKDVEEVRAADKAASGELLAEEPKPKRRILKA